MQSRLNIRRFIGNRAFYMRVIAIAIPMLIQNTITNVVSLLDNVMVGQVGTLPMSAVAIINQLLFIYNLCIFGGMAGAGIFATQFAGAKDDAGVRYCFRLKLFIGAAMLVIAYAILMLIPDQLIGMYLTGGASDAEREATMLFGKDYLNVMMIGLLPFAVTQIYASTLRETGETRLPMIASIVSILVNLCFNYLLIFGHLGFPKLGVVGAAAATVLSRFVEMAIIVVYTHLRHLQFPFIQSVYRSLHVPSSLCINVMRKGMPLLINEFLWSLGMAMLMQCYSIRGLDVVAASNISSTITNLFNVVFMSMGSAVSIMVGQALGADDPVGAKDTAYKLVATSVVTSAAVGIIMFLISPLIPHIYNTEPEVRDLACSFLRVVSVMMPIYAFAHCCYFTLRSGGRTMITFVFDSVFTWVACFPCAYLLAHFTDMPIIPLYICVQALDLLKCFIGGVMMSKGIWIRNIVADQHSL